MTKTNALIGLIILVGIGGLIMFPKIKDGMDDESNKPKIAGPQTPPPTSPKIETEVKNNTQTEVKNTPVETKEETVVLSHISIAFNGSSYTPSTVTIKTGQKVIFKNESDKIMWPASDPHPAHTNFSLFDPRKSIESGGIYEFVFEKSGTYTYHDHRTPSAKGVIIVQ